MREEMLSFRSLGPNPRSGSPLTASSPQTSAREVIVEAACIQKERFKVKSQQFVVQANNKLLKKVTFTLLSQHDIPNMGQKDDSRCRDSQLDITPGFDDPHQKWQDGRGGHSESN